MKESQNLSKNIEELYKRVHFWLKIFILYNLNIGAEIDYYTKI